VRRGAPPSTAPARTSWPATRARRRRGCRRGVRGSPAGPRGRCAGAGAGPAARLRAEPGLRA
jgi:hypothetical protein